MKVERIVDYAPLGIDWRRELKWLLLFWILCILLSFGYLIDLYSCIDDLYGWERAGGRQVKVLRGTMMPDFGEVLGSNMNALIIGALLVLLISVYHYIYHFQGSHSIYLMRRLPAKLELTKRCVTLPAAGACVMLATVFVLVPLYFGLYMLCVPDVCIVPDQWGRFIASAFGG